MVQILPVTEVRKRLLQLVEDVDQQYGRVDITKNGRVKATLVSPDYLDSLEETIYTLDHSIDEIHRAEKEIKQGRYVTLEQLEKDLKKRQENRKR